MSAASRTTHPNTASVGVGRALDANRTAVDTRARFVREIVQRVDRDRIAELHLFTPIRHGATESGVAVVAARPVAADGSESSDAAVDAGVAVVADATGAVGSGEVKGEPAVADGDDLIDARGEDARGEHEAAIEPGRADGVDRDEAETSGPDDSTDALVPASTDAASRPAVPTRHTIYTARYRLVVKGPERGRWEAEVREEADAPLLTVDEVVRGVQRRAGDAGDPMRLDAAAVTALVDG